MRNLFLIFHGRFPSEKAAALFAAKSAEAFAGQGLETTIVAPRRLGRSKQSASAFYGVRATFGVEYLPVIDLFWLPFVNRFSTTRKIAFFVSFASFSLSCTYFFAIRLAKRATRSETILFSNEWLPLLALSFLSKNTFYEMHDFPESGHAFFVRFLCRMRWVLIHNRWKSEKAQSLFGIDSEKILCRANAVDITQFAIPLSKVEARKQLTQAHPWIAALAPDTKLVMYTGHLYGWKGVDTLAAASALLSPNTKTIFVGGTPADVASFKLRHAEVISNGKVVVIGHRPHTEIPVWQKAADVLVLPNTAKEDISKYYTSPMKLFEYMASNRPIVASDIPSIREIADDHSVLFVPADDAEALAKGISRMIDEPALSNSLARAAFEQVKANTWQARAAEICAFVHRQK
ncbi:MAG: glycosyltransferase [Patescibacteria group bacterium]